MRFFRVLRRLHRDEDAQISFLAVAGVVCFTGLLSMVINTDDLVSERVRVQNVADATVLSAASWTARGLNVESYINVLNTKLIATAVLLNALKDSLPVIQASGQIQQAIFQGCSGVPFIGAFCAVAAAIVTVQLKALSVLKNLVDRAAQQLSACNGSATLWKIMKSLERVGEVVQRSFPVIGIAESVAIARENGAIGLVLNGTFASADQLRLPVERKPFAEFCEPMKNGGPGYQLQGYKVGQGPLELGRDRISGTLLLPWFNFFASPIFKGMLSAHVTQIGCMPDPGDEEKTTVMFKDLAQCRKYDATSRWSHIYSMTRPIEDGSLTAGDFVPWRPLRPENNTTSEEAPDGAAIEQQLKDLGLDPSGQPSSGAGDQPQVATGRAYQYLDPNTERRGSYEELAEADCDDGGFPIFMKPGATWGASPGNMFCIGGVVQDCRRIDEWDVFTWYNTEPTRHVRGGTPEKVGGYFIRMAKREVDPAEEGGKPRYVYFIETVSLVDAGRKEMDQEEFKEYLEDNGQEVGEADTAASSCGNDKKPQPWILTKDAENYANRLKFIGVVYESVSDDPPFWTTYFTEPPPRLIAYAQAEVYNHLSEDTFTQDWRVRLEPSSLLTQALRKVGGTVGLTRVVDGVVDSVNNH